MRKWMYPKRITDNEWHHIIVSQKSDFCCHISIEGYEPKDKDDWAFISIGKLSSFPSPDYCYSFMGRLKTMWAALRGRLWGYEIEFYTHEDFDLFMKAMNEMGNRVFQKDRGYADI